MVDLGKFVQDDAVKPTSCVYMDDSYLQVLDVNVVKVSQEKRDVYLLLDRTIFHPKSGGQPSDVGVIEGWTTGSRLNGRCYRAEASSTSARPTEPSKRAPPSARSTGLTGIY